MGKLVAFKCVMLGEQSVGKTCLVNRFIKGNFAEVESTIAGDFKAKVVKIQDDDQDVKIRLQIWDTAGSEQYKSLA